MQIHRYSPLPLRPSAAAWRRLVLVLALGATLCLGGEAVSGQDSMQWLTPVPPTSFVAVSGSNATGDGSAGNPWATIDHALNNVGDGSLILVGAGTYFGRIRLDRRFANGVVIRSQVPYQARLRNNGTVITVFQGEGITLEGFDIAHDGAGAGALVIQVQDLIGPAGGSEFVSRITLRDNVIHDSWNNDLLKINNGAGQITVEGNLFYNQEGSDEHIDINSVTDVVVRDNVFFNDFEGSGRVNGNDTSSFIVIKDSNGSDDTNLGSLRITVQRNVFLHWQGSTGSNFVLLGEDGQPFFEAREVTVENNLLLGDSGNTMRAPFGVKGCRDALFRNNTVVGDLPALAYTMRLNTEGANPPNENISFFNNIWSDAIGSFGAVAGVGGSNDFSDTPLGQTATWQLRRNLYFNGASPIPFDPAELINFTDDPERIVSNPALVFPSGILLPRWVSANGAFADGSLTIAQVFSRLANFYGRPVTGGAGIGAADPANSPPEDILGRPRSIFSSSLGAYESVEEIFVDGFESGDTAAWVVVP